MTVTDVVTIAPNDTLAREQFGAAVRARTLDGYLLVEPDAQGATTARYVARETSNPTLIRNLRLAVQSVALDKLLAGTGVDGDAVRRTQQLALDSITLSDRGERPGGFQTAFISTFVLGMLLYVAVIINGQGMATAIVEEKSSRLIEVILGAVTATEFMTGKILGVLGSGLTQLAIWLAVSVVALLQATPAFMLNAGPEFDMSAVLNARVIFYYAVFFALGYLLYSILFAIVAVTCTSTEELGQSMMAAVLPMVVAMMAAMSVMANPATTMTRVLSLFPYFTPLVMLARVNVLMPPLWEVWLGVAIMLATSVASGWIAAKIFRYALLMTGKRPTLPELMRVVRAG
jgi:ABC-2 type transport system permease protein